MVEERFYAVIYMNQFLLVSRFLKLKKIYMAVGFLHLNCEIERNISFLKRLLGFFIIFSKSIFILLFSKAKLGQKKSFLQLLVSQKLLAKL